MTETRKYTVNVNIDVIAKSDDEAMGLIVDLIDKSDATMPQDFGIQHLHCYDCYLDYNKTKVGLCAYHAKEGKSP